METDTTESQLVENKPGFVARLFHGDISLPVTYWVFGALVGVVSSRIISQIIEFNYFEITSSQTGVWAVMGFSWITVGLHIFLLIAIWRSAGKYQGRAIWASLARVAVVFSTLVLIGNFGIMLRLKNNSDFALSEGMKMINKSLPSMMDNNTRLVHVSIQDKDVYYNYTFVNWLAADPDIKRFTSAMTPKLKTAYCTIKDTRSLLNEGRKLVHMYRDKSSKPVVKIVIEKSDCL